MLKTILPITGVSALQFWLDFSKRKNPDSYSFKSCKRTSFPEKFNVPTDKAAITLTASELGLSLPLHVMVLSDRNKHRANTVNFSIKPMHLPKNSFVRLNPEQLPIELAKMEIYIASPEYCFLIFASKLPFELLIELGFNLCANYAYDFNAELSQKFRKPITCVSLMKKYILSAEQNIGFQKARRALRYICDESFSPMETKLAVYSILPYSAGGQSLSGPTMNEEIFLTNVGSKLLGRSSCKGDIVWKEERVAVEYDSNLTHLTSKQHTFDKAKANALKSAGYTLFSITPAVAKNFELLDDTFRMIRKALERQSRKTILNKYIYKRKSVHAALFNNDLSRILGLGSFLYENNHKS